jgi:hypothetical protein
MGGNPRTPNQSHVSDILLGSLRVAHYPIATPQGQSTLTHEQDSLLKKSAGLLFQTKLDLSEAKIVCEEHRNTWEDGGFRL